jgi:hypothetical protein
MPAGARLRQLDPQQQRVGRLDRQTDPAREHHEKAIRGERDILEFVV